MPVIKCKMCGGDLEIFTEEIVTECQNKSGKES